MTTQGDYYLDDGTSNDYGLGANGHIPLGYMQNDGGSSRSGMITLAMPEGDYDDVETYPITGRQQKFTLITLFVGTVAEIRTVMDALDANTAKSISETTKVLHHNLRNTDYNVRLEGYTHNYIKGIPGKITFNYSFTRTKQVT